MNAPTTPSPEIKSILKTWCKLQEEKYGPDWKNILAKEMAEQTVREMRSKLGDEVYNKFFGVKE